MTARHVVIVGPMGSGKTTLGRSIAEATDRRFLDSDSQIEARYESTARRLAAEHGVEWLHRVEGEALREALAEEEPVVIGAAASTCDLPEVESLLEGAVVILLAGDPRRLAARSEGAEHRRPMDLDRYAELADARHRRLLPTADLVVDVTHRSPEEVVGEILNAIT